MAGSGLRPLGARPKNPALATFEAADPVYLLEFSIAPLDQGQSVSAYVARSLAIVEASGLDYRLHAMGTLVEGELDQVLGVLRQCLAAMAADCDRITCSAKLDFRRGHAGRLEAKVASVEAHLGHGLKRVAAPDRPTPPDATTQFPPSTPPREENR